MKKVRQYMAVTLIAAMTAGMMSVPSIASPEGKSTDGPKYEPKITMYKGGQAVDKHVFFANGVPVTIDAPASGSDAEAGAVITWGDGESQTVPKDTYIFAGGNLDSEFSEGSIVMNGGEVDSLNGGGYGVPATKDNGYDKDHSANVGDSIIEMKGGKVRQIVGGGYGYSKVESVEIIMSGGKSGAVIGGGLSSVAGFSDTSTAEDAQNSPCSVGSVTMTLTGGAVKDYPDWKGAGGVNGGGQGYSSTGEATINIDGNVDLSQCFLIGGGSNGYTGNAEINVRAGQVKVLQSVNRGTMDSAEINVTGGTIEKLYGGGETTDNSVNGKVSAIKLNLIRGEIKELYPGSNGTAGTDIAPDSDILTARYGKNVKIGNLDAAKTAFGSSLQLLPTDIELNKTSLTMAIGQKETLTAKITGGTASDSDMDGVIWSSSNDEVVSVDNNGLVTAEGAGTATVTAAYAKDEAIAASCTITVKQPELKIDPKSATIKVGATLELEAIASPSDADIEWEPIDGIILADETERDEDAAICVVKAIGVGETTVTAYLSDNEDVKAVCKVKVVENKKLPIDEQVESIVNGLENALSGGPGSEDLTPEKKAELVDKAVETVAKVVTPEAVGKLKDIDDMLSVYERITSLEDTLENNFSVSRGVPDDSNAGLTLKDYSGLLANIDIAAAGGALPEAGGEDEIIVNLELEEAELPAGAEALVVADSAAAVDIKLVQGKNDDDTQAIQPRIPVLLVVEAPESVDLTKTVKVWNYHNGTARVLKSWVDEDAGEISFLADKFSVFVIGNVKESTNTKPSSRGSRSGGGASGWHPQGTWLQTDAGWKFKNYDGTYAADCWKQLSYNGREDWYHFDILGLMQTGWFTDKDGQVYYLNPVPDGYRGAMLTGWQVIEEKYYYFNPVSDGTRGALYVNRTTPDGYRVAADGSRVQ